MQYADIDDAWNYSQTARRFYRHALKSLAKVIDNWKEDAKDCRFQFIIDLGDLIDGKNKPIGQSQQALEKVMRLFQEIHLPAHHCIGNHELYNFDSLYLQNHLVKQKSLHYSFTVESQRFILLNSFGFSILGTTSLDTRARELIAEKNPNEDKNSSLNMEGLDQRFVEYGGGIDSDQLNWLSNELQIAQDRKENVFIFTHIPLHPSTCTPNCLLWNYHEVLEVIQQSPTVQAVFSGHAHQNGSVTDEYGIHYIVMAAILESKPPNGTAYANVRVYKDHIDVIGFGQIPSQTFKCRQF